MIMERFAAVLNRVIDDAVYVLLIFVLLMCIYAGYDSCMVYSASGTKDLIKWKPEVTGDEPVRVLPGSVAWLTVDDTTIDYPVMQGEDNTEYLNKDPYGEYSLSGSIFLDAANTPDFTDDYSLLYGHHMEYGAMFGSLDEFQEPEYFESHRSGTLIVGEKTYGIRIFAEIETDASVEEIFDPKGGYDLRAYLQEHADIYEEPEEGRIIGLSTCASYGSTKRRVVFGTIR